MNKHSSRIGSRSLWIIPRIIPTTFLILTIALTASAQTEIVLHKFAGTPDGASPSGRLISDNAGNLYGTTINGGAAGKGTVFELSPPSGSGTGWSESVLYSFIGGSTDGSGPWGGLVFDASGNLYGTTEYGGSRDGTGFGTVFVLSPPSIAMALIVASPFFLSITRVNRRAFKISPTILHSAIDSGRG
jgi:uncharacterized repeat protein (TIGR03803 family)